MGCGKSRCCGQQQQCCPQPRPQCCPQQRQQCCPQQQQQQICGGNYFGQQQQQQFVGYGMGMGMGMGGGYDANMGGYGGYPGLAQPRC